MNDVHHRTPTRNPPPRQYVPASGQGRRNAQAPSGCQVRSPASPRVRERPGGETREGPDRPVDNGLRSGSRPDEVGPKGGSGPDPSLARAGLRSAPARTRCTLYRRSPARIACRPSRDAPEDATHRDDAPRPVEPAAAAAGGAAAPSRLATSRARPAAGRRRRQRWRWSRSRSRRTTSWPLAPVGVALLSCSAAACPPAGPRCSASSHGLGTFVPLLAWLTVIGPDAWLLVAVLEALVPGAARCADAVGAPAAGLAAVGGLPVGGRGAGPGLGAVRRVPVGSARLRRDGLAVHAVRRAGRRAAGDLRDRPVRCPAGRGGRAGTRVVAPGRPAGRCWRCAVPVAGPLLPVGAGEGRPVTVALVQGNVPGVGMDPSASASRCCATTSTPPTGSRPTSGPAGSTGRTWWCGRRTPRTSTRSRTRRRRP